MFCLLWMVETPFNTKAMHKSNSHSKSSNCKRRGPLWEFRYLSLAGKGGTCSQGVTTRDLIQLMPLIYWNNLFFFCILRCSAFRSLGSLRIDITASCFLNILPLLLLVQPPWIYLPSITAPGTALLLCAEQITQLQQHCQLNTLDLTWQTHQAVERKQLWLKSSHHSPHPALLSSLNCLCPKDDKILAGIRQLACIIHPIYFAVWFCTSTGPKWRQNNDIC